MVLPSLRSAKPQKITIACTIIGVPLNISIYADSKKSAIFLVKAAYLFFGFSVVRKTPTRTPIKRPTAVPIIATKTV